jgi:hypothetical protein
MVVVFKRHCINTISWTGDEAVPWRVAYYPELPGTIYPGSVQVSASGVIYLAQDGLRLFSGNSSTPVAPNVMLEITAIAADQANAVTSTFDQRLRRYMLGVPTAGQTDNNRVWELHLDPEQVKLFKRSQQVSAFGFFYRVSPLTFATLPVSFQQAPFSFDDPLVLGSYPVLVSGDYDGEVYEHEVTTDDDGETVESFVELGPFPKDPNITMLVDKRLIEMRLRGYKTANTTLTIKIRPIHSTVWTTLTDSPDMSTHEDSDSHIIPVDISGEQFFIRLENDQQYGWPQFYYIGLFGTSTGRPRRR